MNNDVIESIYYIASETGPWITIRDRNKVSVIKDQMPVNEAFIIARLGLTPHSVYFVNGDIYDFKLHSWRHLYKPQPIPDTSNIKDILSERGSRYGDFAGHALLTQALKDTFAEHSVSYERLIPPMVEAIEMIFHKLGRIGNGNPFYADSWVDIVGYAQLVVDILKGEGENK